MRRSSWYKGRLKDACQGGKKKKHRSGRRQGQNIELCVVYGIRYREGKPKM